MALQSSGAITLAQIAAEFGGSAPHSLNEYYRGGANVPSSVTQVPASGTIDFADFYGTQAGSVRTLNNNDTNVNVQTLFGSDFSSSINKILIISSGHEIGATGGSTNRAITVPSGMSGTLDIQNAGTISGAGGIGGGHPNSSSNGDPGGSAIFIASANVTITNTGTIRGGGGGGGKGNNGSAGASVDSGAGVQCVGGSIGGGGSGGTGQGYNSAATNGGSGGQGGTKYTYLDDYPNNINQSPGPTICNTFYGAGTGNQNQWTDGTDGTDGGNGGTFGNVGVTPTNPAGGTGGAGGKYIELSGVSLANSPSGTLVGNAP